MFFKDVPESKLLTKNSRFVYSEDDEHLKYIRDFYFKRGYQEVSNEYGTNEPGILGSQTYELMNYDYNQTRLNTHIEASTRGIDGFWVSDWYKSGRFIPESEYYAEKDNKVNIKWCWGSNSTSYYDNNVMSEYEPDPDTPGRYDVTTKMAKACSSFGWVPTYTRNSEVIPYFPLGKYELKFKVRLHNIDLRTRFEYWMELATTYIRSEGKETIIYPNGTVIERPYSGSDYGTSKVYNVFPFTAYINNGIFISMDGAKPSSTHYFKNQSGSGIDPERSFSIIDVREDGDSLGIFSDPTRMPYNVNQLPDPGKPLVKAFANVEPWKVCWARDELGLDVNKCIDYFDINYPFYDMEPDLIKWKSETKGFSCLYNSYFIKLGNDSDWHEFSILLDPDDYYCFPGIDSLPYLMPTIELTLSGAKPLSTDAYIEFKDVTIKSKPYKYSDTHMTDIEHFYVNKSGMWLPDNFVKADDNFTLTQIRTTGTVSAEVNDRGNVQELYTKPIVMTADATANYQTGTKVCDILVNDVPVPIMYPFSILDGAETTVASYTYNIYYNGKMTFRLWKNNGLKYTASKYIYTDLPKFSGMYNFGNVNLNGTNSTTFEFYSSDISGTVLFEVYVDISTSAAYIPDDDTEYIKLSVQSSSMINYISGGILEKRIPMSIFKNQAINHKKIKLEFLGYIDGSYYSYSLVTNVVGKLKSGATLTANALKVTVKYNRIGPTTQ